ncbi:MAG TPA: DUF6265 family protein [Ignavibacteriaceae bacterium]|nr:DUF6265 family protein [Ignavibacteriaceae bacterium]
MLKNLAVFFLLSAGVSLSQTQKFENTFSKEEGKDTPKATLENIKWLTGHWKGEAFGGVTEEIWSPPAGGSMMCSFRLIVKDKVEFYELCTITEENNSLMLKIKHFHSDLKGWEDKNVTVDFPLVKVEPNKYYFDEFTIEKINDNEINMYVVIQAKGKENEVKFNYKRVD